MANRWGIPTEVETRLRREFKTCAYCGRRMKSYRGKMGCPGDKATIEHLNRRGPFYWSDGLCEDHLVIVCSRCNASRGRLTLFNWLKSSYCLEKKISTSSVASRVRKYLQSPFAKR